MCIRDSWIGDKMHPEREIQNIQKNNPLTDELKGQILSIEGVEKVEESFFAGALITNIEELKEDDGAPLDSGICLLYTSDHDWNCYASYQRTQHNKWYP